MLKTGSLKNQKVNKYFVAKNVHFICMFDQSLAVINIIS